MKTTKMRPLKRKFGFAKSKLVSRFCHSQGVYITQIKVSSKFVKRFRSNYSKPIGCVFPKSILPVSALFLRTGFGTGQQMIVDKT